MKFEFSSEIIARAASTNPRRQNMNTLSGEGVDAPRFN